MDVSGWTLTEAQVYIKEQISSGKRVLFTSKKNKLVKERIDELISTWFATQYPGVELEGRMIVTLFMHDMNPPKCPECGKNCKFKYAGYGFDTYCSWECSLTGRVETHKNNMLDKYGVENISQSKEHQKAKIERYRKKYGVENPSQLPEVQEKRTHTFLESGRSGPLSCPEALAKFRNTSLENWGVENPSSSEEIKRRRGEWLESLSPEQRSRIAESGWETRKGKNPDFYKIIDDREEMERLYIVEDLTMEEIGSITGVNKQTVCNKLKEHGIEAKRHYHQSAAERDIARTIEALGFEVQMNVTDILKSGKEIDIFVPEKNFGIEHNGLRYHSDRTKPRSYHKHKHDEADEAGIQLFSIWEDEWSDARKREITINSLKMKLGVMPERTFARETKVDHCGLSKEVVEFLESHHIQGSPAVGRAAKLTKGGETVAVMVFRKVAGSDGEYELTRWASKGSVVGGFTKCLKSFIRETPDVKKIISFSDRMKGNGAVYERNGFVYIHTTAPNYTYTEGHYRINKEHFRRERMKERFKDFDPRLSEAENARNNGFYRAFNSGLLKYCLFI